MADEKKTRQSKTNRLAERIQTSLAGKASKPITVKATLTGTAAEVWVGLQKEAEGLGMTDQALLAALLDAGGVYLQKALKAIPRG